MKVKIKTTIEVELVKMIAVMGIRYWEDAKVNGVTEDEDKPLIPFRGGDHWKIEIDIETGKIKGWPAGTTAETHYKVCDEGEYWVEDKEGNKYLEYEGYVPSVLAPDGGSYGDYVILEINEEGIIEGWNFDVSCFPKEDDEE